MSAILKCWSTDVLGFRTKLYLKHFLSAFIFDTSDPPHEFITFFYSSLYETKSTSSVTNFIYPVISILFLIPLISICLLIFMHTETITWNLLWGNYVYLRHPIDKGVVTRVVCHSVCMFPLTHFIHITSSSSANWSSVWRNIIFYIWKVFNKIWYNAAFN